MKTQAGLLKSDGVNGLLLGLSLKERNSASMCQGIHVSIGNAAVAFSPLDVLLRRGTKSEDVVGANTKGQ